MGQPTIERVAKRISPSYPIDNIPPPFAFQAVPPSRTSLLLDDRLWRTVL